MCPFVKTEQKPIFIPSEETETIDILSNVVEEVIKLSWKNEVRPILR